MYRTSRATLKSKFVCCAPYTSFGESAGSCSLHWGGFQTRRFLNQPRKRAEAEREPHEIKEDCRQVHPSSLDHQTPELIHQTKPKTNISTMNPTQQKNQSSMEK